MGMEAIDPCVGKMSLSHCNTLRMLGSAVQLVVNDEEPFFSREPAMYIV
jgi:hypothetical protein